MVSGSGLIQREGLVNLRFDLAAFDKWPDMSLQLGDQIGFFLRSTRAQGRADMGQPLLQHGKQIQIGGCARNNADLDYAAIDGGRRIVARDILPANDIENDVGAMAIGGCMHCLDKIFLLVEYGHIRAQLDAGGLLRG